MVSPKSRQIQIRPSPDGPAVRRCGPSHDPNPRHRRLREPQCLSSPTQQWSALDWWARDRAIGTEHATIASEGLKPRPAALAVIEELAGIGWHCLDGLVAA